MIINLILLLVTFPIMVYHLSVGNIYLGAFMIIPVSFASYMLISGQETTKAGQFLKVLTEEKAESPEELMMNLSSEMTDVEEKMEDLENQIEENIEDDKDKGGQ